MITRIVKLQFKPANIARFTEIFHETKPFILKFEGCLKVELMKDAQHPDRYFTLSYWNSEDDLNNYRNSTFFKETWAKVKPLFAEKAEAWSLITIP
ncbi:MAG: antibiotic biosynthesis monooxygenase family protein [Daejeonella sp.]